jgi:hypothetical protein
MPRFVNPGVYVEEIAAEPHPIPGVPTSTDADLSALAAELRRAARAWSPEWTDFNDGDPGVTVLEVFAFLAESVLYRAGEIPERGRSAATRAAASLLALGCGSDAACAPTNRPLYFAGRLLDAATLTDEQDYHRGKRRRHARELHGSGVVRGLDVRWDDDGGRVVVEPGYAIDANGEEICLPIAVRLAPSSSGDPIFATLRYWERPCGTTPEGPSRMEEACVVGLGAAPSPPALALARLVHDGVKWRVDPTWQPPRVHGT